MHTEIRRSIRASWTDRQTLAAAASNTMDEGEQLAFALEATGTGLWRYDAKHATLTGDQQTGTLIGMSVDDPVSAGQLISAVVDTEQRCELEALFTDGLGDRPRDLELLIRRPDTGREAWVMLRGRADGYRGNLIGTIRDLTDLKRHDEHVHMLMREVTHRSKNLLAIIQAMARQTVKDSLSAADFEARFSTRLRGLSFSHELLAGQDWRGASLKELADGHLSHLREQHGSRIQVIGPIIFVRPEAAQNIGLALNELASNAQKYGALSSQHGTVRLEWHIDANEAGPQALHVLWTEAGGATDLQPPSRLGFGRRVMERVVARALDAAVSMSFAPTGLRWSLRIPLSHIASDTAG